MSGQRRYVALRGKITPTSRERFGSAVFGGTVDRAQGSAGERARDVDERERSSAEAAAGAAGEHEIASEVSERIRAIIASAEAAANAVRHEAEQRAQVKRGLAEEEARRIVDDARRDAEAYLAERIRRISELSDAVVERGEGIVMRLDRAEEVRRQLQGLADALGESAEELARELGGTAEAAPDRRATPEAIAAEAAAPEASSASPEASPAAPEASTPATPEASTPAASPEASAPASTASPSTDAASPSTDAASSAGASAEIAEDPTVGELATEAAADEEPARAVELVPDEADERPREPDEQLSARLVALQMAVAGGKRDEVETHLRRTFDLGDVGQILDDVFGAGDGGNRAGWPSGPAA